MKRDIYEYMGDDGEKRYGDPLRILNTLTDYCGGDLSGVCRAAASPAANIASKAQRSLDEAGRKAFDLADFDPTDGSGRTMGEVSEMLADFYDWLDQKKNPAENSPTLPATSEEPERTA